MQAGYSASPDLHSAWESKLKEAQDLTTQATQQEFSSNYSLAQISYTKSAEIYLWLIRNFNHKLPYPIGSSDLYNGVSNHQELKNRITKACEKVLKRAELIRQKNGGFKVERDRLSQEEQSRILSLSSKVNGLVLEPWHRDPSPELFELTSGSLFEDPEGQPALCQAQIQQSAKYSRSHRTSKSHLIYDESNPLRGRDILQDVITDCSFVAALEVAAEYDRKWGTKLATSALYPQSSTSRNPVFSKSGLYLLKFYINGIARKIAIDDSLPTSPQGKLICAASSSNSTVLSESSKQESYPISSTIADSASNSASSTSDQSASATSSKVQYYPALIEKAYLRMMGGYSFPGSNSSIDLHFLTGWIPEQLWLKHAGFQREKSWKRLLKGWNDGDCLITVGTGKSFGKRSRDLDVDEGAQETDGSSTCDRPEAEIQEDGFQLNDEIRLINSHDYAVLDLKEVGNRREVTLMNPWRTNSSSQDQSIERSRNESSLNSSESKNNDSIFTIPWDNLCSNFHSIYLNWKPDLFPHNISIHSSWKTDKSNPNVIREPDSSTSILGKTISQNPQFRLIVGDIHGVDDSNKSSPSRNAITRPSTSGPTANPSPRPSNTRAASANSDALPPNRSRTLEVQTEAEIEIWLLLVRHIRQREREMGKNEFIAIHVFEGSEKSEGGVRSSVKLGTYVDGTHNLIRFKTKSRSTPRTYTLVVSRHQTSRDSSSGSAEHALEEEVGFTISAYSRSSLSISEMPKIYPFRESILGSWNGRNCGGNVSNPTFMNNPMFSILIPSSSSGSSSASIGATSISVLLEAPKELPVQVMLVYTSTSTNSSTRTLADQRVSHLVSGDVIASSGPYHHGVSLLETSNLKPGLYTLILSCFEPGSKGSGPFSLTIDSNSRLTIATIPLEGAGMYSRTLKGEWDPRNGTANGSPSSSRRFSGVKGGEEGGFDKNPTWIIRVGMKKDEQSSVSRLDAGNSSARFIIRLNSILEEGDQSVRPYINASIFSIKRARTNTNTNSNSNCNSDVSSDPHSSTLALDYSLSQELFSSGPYDEHVSGVSVDFKNSRLVKGEYALVLSTFKPGWKGRFRVEVYSDKPIDCERVR